MTLLTNIRQISRHWWSSLLVMPLLLIASLVGGYFLIYPLFTYGIYLPSFSSFSVIKGVAIGAALFVPLFGCWVLSVKPWVPLFVELVFLVFILKIDIHQLDGNRNSGLAMEAFPMQVMAMGLSALWILFMKRWGPQRP